MDRYRNIFQLLLGLVCFVLLIANCEGKDANASNTDQKNLVETIPLKAPEQGSIHAYPGRVQAKHEADLSFEEPGKIIEFPVREGEHVKKGDLIAKLDDSDYQNRYNQENAKYDYIYADYQRYNKLLKSGTVTKADYDLKLAALKVQESNLAIAKKALAEATLLAPFDGFIAKKYVNNFQLVLVHQSVVSLQDLSDIEIVINIPEQDFYQARDIEGYSKNEKLTTVEGTVTFPMMPNQIFTATLKEFSIESEASTPIYKMTFTMPRPGNAIILPGMTAEVSLKFSKSN